jgi:catechol 2,3-dioxygenase-like lactoylglutathione lyase family enzyme
MIVQILPTGRQRVLVSPRALIEAEGCPDADVTAMSLTFGRGLLRDDHVPTRSPAMPINRVLAALAVSDVDAALSWYERLLGRPADALPMDGLAEWHYPQSGVIQLVEDTDRAGRSLLTLGVDDLERELLLLRERGLDAGAMDDTSSDKVKFATVTDPEGNEITLVEQR